MWQLLYVRQEIYVRQRMTRKWEFSLTRASSKFRLNKKSTVEWHFDKSLAQKTRVIDRKAASISGKAKEDRNKRKGNEPSHEHKYPAARRCPIRSPSKIDGFLITEKNRQNDLFTATPRVVNSKNYTWTTWFFFMVHSAKPCPFSSSKSAEFFFYFVAEGINFQCASILEWWNPLLICVSRLHE